jgi:hypothetical protein
MSAETFEVSRLVGQGTANTAEFIALETAIDEARSRFFICSSSSTE